jgi:purine-binding chemotaxis protein CheW
MNQFIIFKLAIEEFAVEITDVQEIIKLKEITKLPQTAHYFEGVIDLRGEIIAVLDLRKKFGFEEKNNDNASIIIINVNGLNIGFIVDDASEVIRISQESISNSNAEMVGIKDEFLEGIARVDERLIIILDMSKLISSQQRVELAKFDQKIIK